MKLIEINYLIIHEKQIRELKLMDDEKSGISKDFNESYLEYDAEDEGIIGSFKRSVKEHKKMHESIKEHKEFLKSLPKYDRKLMKGYMRGFTKTLILWLIRKERQHGYEIMTQLHEASPFGGKLKTPNPSMVYPLLHDLEKHGLINGTWEYRGKRRLKYYEITEEGEKTLERIKSIYKTRENTLIEEFVKDMFFKEE